LYDEILYEVRDPVAIITLNRPDRLNAFTTRMGAEIRHAFAEAQHDKRVVGIVVTGAGRGFCAGADMETLRDITKGRAAGEIPAELASAEPGDPAFGEDFRGSYTFPMSIPKPVIAAVNGAVAGMGVPMILACDIRFASDRAVFTTSFSRRGLIAEWGISWLLDRIVGPAHALDLLFSARKVDAAEAERIGLVNRVDPHDDLLAHACDYIEELARYSSPTSMAIMKRQVYQNLTQSLGPAEKEAVQLMLESFQRPDLAEGVAAFMEKRLPRFERV
jgi:enoyl-CoA hydratase/carnithine racemase